MSKFKRFFLKLHWVFSCQFGFDLLRLQRSLRGIPAFIADWWVFRKTYVGPLSWVPCLHDRFEEGGVTKNEYFWQDLLVARWIYEAAPEKHVDVGSRVDGFVAHVASFRQIEVLDVRPITTDIPGISFRQVNLMRPFLVAEEGGYCDSLSCLHALEHFGLGRYGDPIDSGGHEKGLANLAALVKPRGVFYLSCPIGRQRVEFNANRVFDPRVLVDLACQNGFSLKKMIVVGSSGHITNVSGAGILETLALLALEPYNLGIFVFCKNC